MHIVILYIGQLGWNVGHNFLSRISFLNDGRVFHIRTSKNRNVQNILTTV